MERRNKPYVKTYNESGNVTNPIPTGYFHSLPNRKQRREPEPTKRFIGNGKNYPLTVIKTGKFRRFIQFESDKDGNLKRIYHYLPC